MGEGPQFAKPLAVSSFKAAIDAAANAFDSHWASGATPSIDDFLPADPAHRAAALLELVHIDMERRILSGESVRAADYLARYPELNSDPGAASDLLAAEHELLDKGKSRTPQARGGPPPKRVRARRRPTANSPSDQNLLFGVMALQLNFVDQAALIAAMQAWMNDKSKSLAQILLERQALQPDAEVLLSQLIQKHLELHNGSAPESLAALSTMNSVCDQLRGIGDTDLEQSVSLLMPSRAAFEATLPLTNDASGPPDRRFHIKHLHKVGGLGEVYVADDLELNREVAIKQIQSKYADDPEGRTRFLREAEITGRLEHPGIVPVYGMGSYDNGRPYYAMRFIKGDSFKVKIHELHREFAAKNDAREVALKFRKLLGHFLDACNAVEYAHSRGVLHRDIKPDNIMVGKFGETLVVDWGLAKVAGRKERLPNWDEDTLPPRTGGEALPTQVGAKLGTPAYMSPEQAAGNLDQLSPATDVYSLGATLYHLLTGRPPFSGETLQEVLDLVTRGVFTRPRLLNRAIPIALEETCLTAMSLDPNARHASVQGLADEIERWIASDSERELRLNAEKQSRLANAYRLSAQSRECLNQFPQRSLLLAVTALEQTLMHFEPRLMAAEQALRDALETVGGRPLSACLPASRCQALSPDGRWYLTGSGDRKARLWDLWQTEQSAPMLLVGSDARIDVVAISPDSRWALTTGRDGTAFLWDLTAVDPSSESVSLKFSPITDESREQTGSNTPQPTRRACIFNSAAFSQCGRWLAAGGSDRAVRLWDLSAGPPFEPPVTTLHHARSVSCVAFSPDSRWLATAGEDKRILLWDPQLGESSPPQLLTGHTQTAFAMAWSADSRSLVTVDRGGGVVVWDLTQADAAPTSKMLRGHRDRVNAIVVSPDTSWLATVSDDKTARLWDLTELDPGSADFLLQGHSKSIEAAAISYNGRWLATGSGDKTVMLWNYWADDPSNGSVCLRGHEGTVRSICASSQTNTMVTAGDDGIARVWQFPVPDVAPGGIVLWGHVQGVRFIAISSDSRWLATSAGGKSALLWDLATPTAASKPLELSGHKRDITSLAMVPGDRWLVTCDDQDMLLWDLQAADPASSGRVLTSSPGRLTTFAASANGRHLVVARADGLALLWDMDSEQFASPRLLHAHTSGIYALTISANGRWLVTRSDDETTRLWDLDSQTRWLGSTLLDRSGEISSTVMISLDSRWLVTLDKGHSASIWDLTRPELAPRRLTGLVGKIHAATISPDSRWLVIVSGYDASSVTRATGVVLGWDLSSDAPTEKRVELAEDDRCYAAMFSLDSRYLLTKRTDGTTRLWDFAEPGSEMRTVLLRGHRDSVCAQALSDDGRYLATGSDDGEVRLWDLNMEDPSADSILLRGHVGSVNVLAISPDGRWLASGGEDKAVRLWHLRISELMALARETAGRELTPEECRQYMIPTHRTWFSGVDSRE